MAKSRWREASGHSNMMKKEMEDVNLSQACQLLCPTINRGGGDDMVAYSWVGVTLFLVSELLTYVDIQPNGIIQSAIHMLRTVTSRNIN
jgi:hypothetical protein